jgi:hypothetical protein
MATLKSNLDKFCKGAINPFGDLLNSFLTSVLANTGDANVYRVTWSQLTTAAQTVVTTFANTLGVTPTLARTSAGIYTITATGKMGASAAKLFAPPIAYIDNAGALTLVNFTWTSANVVTVTATDDAGVAKDILNPSLDLQFFIYN